MRDRRSTCALPFTLLAVLAFTAPAAVAQQLIWKQTGDNTATSGSHQNQDNFGFDVETYDLDGDGVRDLCIGAPWYDSASRPTKIGAVYAALGPIDSTIAAEAILVGIGSEAWPDAGVEKDWAVGYTLVGVDDFYTDEARLLLVGQPDFNWRWGDINDPPTGVHEDAGRAVLYRYNTSTDSLELVTIVRGEGSSGFVEGRHFGYSACRLGNFAGSSSPDFAVGAGQHGRAYAYLGGSAAADTLGPDITYTYTGPGTDLFGHGVAGGANLGGDSHADLVITAERYDSSRGRVYIYFGTSSPGSAYDEGDANVTLTGDATTVFGAEMAVGDVTGDGDADLVVIADLGSPRLYVFAGPFSDSDSLTTADADMELDGLANLVTGSHRALKADADLTGDGINDIVFGRYGPNDSGVAAEVIEGGPHLSGTLTMEDLGVLGATMAPSVPSDSKLGHSVALGDVTGDGRADIVLGAPDDLPSVNPAVDDPGFVFVYDYVRSVFRDRGASAQSAGLDYRGAPTAAIAFTYDASVGTKHLFITLAGSGDAQLYAAGNVSPESGIATINNITDIDDGFVSNDDLPGVNMRGAAAADYDNDGYVDFYVAAPAGTDPDEGARLYRFRSGVGKFADVSDSLLVGDVPLKEHVQNGTAVSWADYDRDGQVDLALTHLDAQGGPLPPVLLRNRVSETGQFDDVSLQEGIDLGEYDRGTVCWTHAWGDPDGDGDLDLFLGDPREREEDPSSRFYFNQRGYDPGFEERVELLGGLDTLGTVASATWVDLNQDTRLDLVLGMTYEQEVGLVFQNDGSLSFTGTSFPASGSSLGAVPVDLDYDGQTELISLPGDDSKRLTVARVASAAGEALAFGDVSASMGIQAAGPVAFALAEDLAGASSTRDGDLDLVLGRTVPSQGEPPGDLLLQNLASLDGQFVSDFSGVDRPPALNWVGIVLKGGGGNNVAGTGARIACSYTDPVRGEIVQTSFVDGGSLRASQRSQIVRFGLGTHSSSVQVAITWPDGYVQTETLSANAINAIYVISDESEPGTPSGESFSYQPQLDGSVNFIFEWNTARASKRELSGITVRNTGAYPCTLDSTVLQGSAVDVLYAMEAVYNSQGLTHYHHTLVWNRECIPQCTYQYKAFNQTTFSAKYESSSWKNARVTVCAQ